MKVLLGQAARQRGASSVRGPSCSRAPVRERELLFGDGPTENDDRLVFADARSALECAVGILHALAASTDVNALDPIRVDFRQVVAKDTRSATGGGFEELAVANTAGPVKARGLARVAELPAVDERIFRKERDFWTIVYEGAILRLPDVKGLRYIAHLLRSPGQAFSVHELVALVAGEVPRVPDAVRNAHSGDASRSNWGIGSAGPILDATARAAYTRRLRDLREELAEAEHFNDEGQTARARAEMEFLEYELAAAVGLGGRPREAACQTERARVAVTLCIKAAVAKIRAGHPTLGHHLGTSIGTGRVCVYTPGPGRAEPWIF